MAALKPDYITATDDNYNVSAQQHVLRNNDPALDRTLEHHHKHLHHDPNAERAREDDVLYSKGTTTDKGTIPHQDPQDHDLSRRKHANVTTNGASETKDIEQLDLDRIDSEEDPQTHTFSNFYRRYRIFFHIFIWIFFTGWWIAGLILHGRKDSLSSRTGWLKPFLFWLVVTLRLVFFHVPITIFTIPMHWVWNHTGVKFAALLPENLKIPLAALLVISVMIIGAFASPESQDNTRSNRAVSLFGLIVILGVLWVTSRNRKMVNWHTVIVGMFMQFIIALFVLRSSVGYDIFDFVSELARDLLGFANQGTIFLTAASVPALGWFLVSVLPAIIFFVALVQLCFYIGILQWFIGKFAVFFFW